MSLQRSQRTYQHEDHFILRIREASLGKLISCGLLVSRRLMTSVACVNGRPQLGVRHAQCFGQ